jgi:hypothetical protein
METKGEHVDRESRAFDLLKGEKKHFCPDWDYMAIDETMDEFDACCCEAFTKKAEGGSVSAHRRLLRLFVATTPLSCLEPIAVGIQAVVRWTTRKPQ